MGGGNCCHPQNPKSSLRGQGGLWDPQQGQSLSQGWRMTPLWSVCRDTPGAPPPSLIWAPPDPTATILWESVGSAPTPRSTPPISGVLCKMGSQRAATSSPFPPPVVPRTEKQQVGGGGGGSQTPALLLAQISKHRGGTAHPAVSIIPPHPPLSPPSTLCLSRPHPGTVQRRGWRPPSIKIRPQIPPPGPKHRHDGINKADPPPSPCP